MHLKVLTKMEESNRFDNNTRPDPDALLKEVEREEAKGGRLKIFLGYAPGVGKTYAMLQEAHVLKNRGEDIVAGIVETHKRAETEALLAGLEIIPRRRVPYENIVLEELDIDAILTRRPSIVLVDELAHTNTPGSRHPKRYQDVEELLESGIDVYATINIQHFQSQVDIVESITGIRMQETVPDFMLDRANEVQVIDIPLEELSERLSEGKVYVPDRAKKAMENFFQRGNLVALRELTLTLAARKMDSELLNYMKAKAITGTWPAGERLVVCIAPNQYAQQLLRRAYNIAQNTRADWYAVYVNIPSVREPSEAEKGYLADALNLAEELGAKAITLMGSDIADEILRFAAENSITRIVIGKPLRSPLSELWRGSPINRLLHARTDCELHLVTPTVVKKEILIKPDTGRFTFNPKAYAISLVMVAVITCLNFFLETVVHPRSLVFLYLIATIASALFFGMAPSLFASVMSLLAFDYFLVEPRFSFTMNHTSDIVNVIVFLLTSIVVGHLVKITRRQNLSLQRRVQRISLIEEISKELLMMPPVEQLVEGFTQNQGDLRSILPLLRTTVLDDISHIMIKYIAKITDASAFVLFSRKDGGLQVWARSSPDTDLGPHEIAVAEWAYKHGEIAGAGTQTLADVKVFFVPMKTPEETVGVIGIEYSYKNLLLDQRRILSSISSISSLGAVRWIHV
jgi:two-component system, OmpR family, sensor histidine kinase KdpD